MTRIAGVSSTPSVDSAGVAPDRAPTLSGASPMFRLHLPLPPSVNRLKRSRTTGKPLGNRTDKVATWRREADVCVWQMQPRPRLIPGDFELEVVWESRRYRRFDIDNRIKVLLDWLQRSELVENDRNCWRLVVSWGPAPRGCVVTVKEVVI